MLNNAVKTSLTNTRNFQVKRFYANTTGYSRPSQNRVNVHDFNAPSHATTAPDKIRESTLPKMGDKNHMETGNLNRMTDSQKHGLNKKPQNKETNQKDIVDENQSSGFASENYNYPQNLKAESLTASEREEILKVVFPKNKDSIVNTPTPTQHGSEYTKKWGDGVEEVPKWKKDLHNAAMNAESTIPSDPSLPQVILGSVKNTLKAGVDSFSAAVIPAAESFGDTISKKLDGEKIGHAVTTGIEKAKDGVEAIKSTVSGIAENIGSISEKAKENIVHATESIPPMANNLKHKAEEMVHSSSVESLKEGVVGVYTKAKETISNTILGTQTKMSQENQKVSSSKDKESM